MIVIWMISLAWRPARLSYIAAAAIKDKSVQLVVGDFLGQLPRGFQATFPFEILAARPMISCDEDSEGSFAGRGDHC
jgi:hypothetical protein